MPYAITVNGTDNDRVFASRKGADKAFELAKADPNTIWCTVVKTTRKDCVVVKFYDRGTGQ